MNYFKEIGNIRQKESFLQEADLNILDINKNYLMFERIGDEEKALIAINRTNLENNFLYPDEYKKNDYIYTLKKSIPGKLTPYGGISMIKRK